MLKALEITFPTHEFWGIRSNHSKDSSCILRRDSANFAITLTLAHSLAALPASTAIPQMSQAWVHPKLLWCFHPNFVLIVLGKWAQHHFLPGLPFKCFFYSSHNGFSLSIVDLRQGLYRHLTCPRHNSLHPRCNVSGTETGKSRQKEMWKGEGWLLEAGVINSLRYLAYGGFQKLLLGSFVCCKLLCVLWP